MSQRTIELPLDRYEADYRAQVEYALSFASEGVESYRCEPRGESAGALVLVLKPGADEAAVREKASKLLDRYSKREFGLKEVVHYRQERQHVKPFDAYNALIDRKWLTPVGVGHVVLRGPAARLWRAIDSKVTQWIVPAFEAEHEVYPGTIQAKTLDRIAHFTSFPEHCDFVAHLREDVDVLSGFSKDCREQGWKPEHHDGRMARPDLAICPSCCYHCYEAMENWAIAKPGRVVTAVLNCHRYEAGNLTTLSRLRSFNMREVVFVGHPEWVKQSRVKLDAMLIEWFKAWDLDGAFENANDMFFTDDYQVKASFQRQQEAKRELRFTIPQEDKRISCSSSNFHAATFGKAFNITVDERAATSCCFGWGLERWVYAVFSQLGLDLDLWPKAIREDLDRYAP